jgi:hypothetical protein
MDQTPESFAYRCLPLSIANAHGWELLNPLGFEATWNGGTGVDSVSIRFDAEVVAERVAVSLFGQGVLTFHVEGIFRTPPGWDLWITGSPNRMKDAIAPLSAVVESDWSPYTFTMNWRFTRPGLPVRFDAMEPFCFVFPVQRNAIEAFAPRFAAIETDSALLGRFQDWSRARNEFHARALTKLSSAPADKWQKHYYRGIDISGESLVHDHRTKLRLKPFDASATPNVPTAPTTEPLTRTPSGSTKPSDEIAGLRLALAKREWLLETLERQRDLSAKTAVIERRQGLGADEFLERYYAVNRPVILTGEMADWPALKRWTPDYLKAKVGSRLVEYQGGRVADPNFEREKEEHRRKAPFDAFMESIMNPSSGNDAYITAFNSERNYDALSVLHEDLAFFDKFLDPAAPQPNGMMWIGPRGTFTALHHDLTNNLIAQIVGRKRLKILPASEVGLLHNDTHVFSRISNLEDPPGDLVGHSRLAGARVYQLTLEAGEVLFMPLAWWHQATSETFSVTLTYTNFLWANSAFTGYPTA